MLNDRTNRAIVVLFFVCLAGATVGFVATGTPWMNSFARGLGFAGAVFFGWALTREADPDRRFSAFLGAAGAGIGALLLGSPHFLLLLWFLLALRFVNRSTGLPPGHADWIGMYGIKLWLGYSTHWAIPLLTLPTIYFASLKRLPRALRVGLPIVLPISAMAYGYLHRWHLAAPQWSSAEMVVLVAVSMGVIPVILSYRRVRSEGDRTGLPLTPLRVQWALAWAAGAAVILTLSGASALRDIAPLWSSLAGASVGWLIESIARYVRTR